MNAQVELGDVQMTEDPTRALPRDPKGVSHGSVGPADPNADPATNPSLTPVSLPETPGEFPTVPTPGLPVPGLSAPASEPEPPRAPDVARTRSGVLWVGFILSAIVLIFLLIFIVQNDLTVRISFLTFSGTLPTGVALLFAAVAGLLLGAIPGGLRIMQLRRAARRSARGQH